MTIRNALLRAFFWLVLGAIALMGALSFVEARLALQSEIAGNLQTSAGAALQRIDTFLFAQFENLRLWRRLEIMQDIRVEDVDKRLSHFLFDLRSGQGTAYRTLFCTDLNGRVVASSDPALIGSRAPGISRWTTVSGGSAALQLQPVHDRRGDTLALRAPIADAFGHGQLGFLYAMLDWGAVSDLLDDAAGGPRSAVLLDDRGWIIGASESLRGDRSLSSTNMQNWITKRGGVTRVRDGSPLGLSTLLVGTAASSGYQHFPGLGWHLLMVEPTSRAYQPIWRMLWSMVTVLLVTLAIAVWTSKRIAGRIAQPIVALTEFTRRYRSGEARGPEVRPGASIDEVDELDRAFVDMMQALEQSREQIVRAGKLAVVGEMAAIMAHEVRTPLGIVRSSAQLLQRRPNLDERERELLDYILSETDRLNRLVTMLLECARPRPPEFKLHDLHDIAGNVLDLLSSKAEKKQISLLREFNADSGVLACDREQLTQVFLNLVLNALDFVPERGRVGIRTSTEGTRLRVQRIRRRPGDRRRICASGCSIRSSAAARAASAWA